MTNYKEIIRMHAGGFSIRTIANSLHCHHSTTSNCIKKAEEMRLSHPIPPEFSNAQIQGFLYPQQYHRDESYELPNCEQLDEEMKKPHMTLTLLWHRYASACRASNLKFYQ